MNSGEVLRDADVAADLVAGSVRVVDLIEGRGEEEALRSVARKAGLGFWTCWGHLQRKRKTAQRSEIGKLRIAYIAYCETAIKNLQVEVAKQRLQGEFDAGFDAGSEIRLIDIEAKLSALALEIRKARGTD